LIDKKIFTDNTIGIEMPESEVQDIDNPEDWKIAELKYTLMVTG
jgi:N-acylneuraminate cytidylyltransferase